MKCLTKFYLPNKPHDFDHITYKSMFCVISALYETKSMCGCVLFVVFFLKMCSK